MKVAVSEIREKMAAALRAKEYDDADIPFVIDMYLGGELRGHTSHGLASFPGFIAQDFSQLPNPEVTAETHAVFMIDAKGHSGNIIGRRAADEAIKRANKEIVGTALIKNMDSWLRPGAIAEYIADKGYFALVINDGGGSSIAPPGGFDPVLATNPIAYGIPTSKMPLVVDMATSKRAWGQVRLANKYNTELPVDTFYNNRGELTLNPKEAYSVLPFGSYKGFSLALMIEILCGSLVGMDTMMLDTNSAGSNFGVPLQNRGGFILVINPRKTTDLELFQTKNSELLQKITDTSTLPNEQIRIPGERAGELAKQRTKADELDVPDELWEEIEKL